MPDAPTPQEIEALIVALTHQTWEGSDSHPDWRAAPSRAATALRALAAENARLRDEMLTAIAYMANAQVDLDMGVPTATTQATLAGGLAKARAALNPTGDDNG